MTPRALTIEQTERVAGHVAGCFRALYSSLGQHAPRLEDDAAVVLVFETARRMGDVASDFSNQLAHRAGVRADDDVASVPEISRVIDESVTFDPSGLATLYVLSMIIGPRLLVTLRDADEALATVSASPLRECLQNASSQIVGLIRRVGDLASERHPVLDESWQSGAQQLARGLETAQFHESFGTGLIG